MLFAPAGALLPSESAMRPSIALISLAALALALGGCDKQSGQGAQQNSPAAGNAAPDEAASDEVPSSGEANGGEPGADASFKHVVDRSHKGDAMPDVSFAGADDKPTTLAKEAAGKPLAVNLWATWCAPCIAELPALDKMAGAASAKGIKVIAVAQDQGGARHVDPFLATHKLANLKRYLDPDTGLGFAYGTSLPTTVLYDAKGKEVARVIGAVEWNGPDGQTLLKEIGG
jgi:thiol-disulfide isomerase/thioredoxin